MIRFSALLTAVAMAVLVAGVSAANLGLIYLSIAVSILAAITLAVGVLLRRREIFGGAEATPRSTQPGWAAAETAKAGPVPVRPAADDRVTAAAVGARTPGVTANSTVTSPRGRGSPGPAPRAPVPPGGPAR